MGVGHMHSRREAGAGSLEWNKNWQVTNEQFPGGGYGSNGASGPDTVTRGAFPWEGVASNMQPDGAPGDAACAYVESVRQSFGGTPTMPSVNDRYNAQWADVNCNNKLLQLFVCEFESNVIRPEPTEITCDKRDVRVEAKVIDPSPKEYQEGYSGRYTLKSEVHLDPGLITVSDEYVNAFINNPNDDRVCVVCLDQLELLSKIVTHDKLRITYGNSDRVGENPLSGWYNDVLGVRGPYGSTIKAGGSASLDQSTLISQEAELAAPYYVHGAGTDLRGEEFMPKTSFKRTCRAVSIRYLVEEFETHELLAGDYSLYLQGRGSFYNSMGFLNGEDPLKYNVTFNVTCGECPGFIPIPIPLPGGLPLPIPLPAGFIGPCTTAWDPHPHCRIWQAVYNAVYKVGVSKVTYAMLTHYLRVATHFGIDSPLTNALKEVLGPDALESPLAGLSMPAMPTIDLGNLGGKMGGKFGAGVGVGAPAGADAGAIPDVSTYDEEGGLSMEDMAAMAKMLTEGPEVSQEDLVAIAKALAETTANSGGA